VGCGILTIGQYLRPTAAHSPMVRYYHPDEFRALKIAALEMGFVHVESGPLVRSSYHAHETADAYERAAGGDGPRETAEVVSASMGCSH
jgi:lipoyl synthase